MSILNRLKPAETLLIINGDSAEFKNLLKLTFMDLCLKKVIEIQSVTKDYSTSRRNKIVELKYVAPGKNFHQYKPMDFEFAFLATLKKSPDMMFPFKKIIQVAYDYVETEGEYRKMILNQSETSELISQNILQKLFKKFKLNPKGQLEKNSINKELSKIDSSIVDLIRTNPKKALESIVSIGGNIFLLKNLDFQLLKTIDKELLNSIKNSCHNTGDDGWYYLDSYDYYDFDRFIDSFDSDFDSFDSDFDSFGCSSDDTGCISCSGCSGCGGCD
jgi:hypothetical protein